MSFKGNEAVNNTDSAYVHSVGIKSPQVEEKKPIITQAFYSSNESTEIEKILESTNRARAKAGLPRVTLNSKLMRAASDYARSMKVNEQMSHYVKGQTLEDRIDAVGYPWRSIGENVALNSDLDGQFVVEQQWMRSEGHRRNILSSKFTEIGIGISGPSKGRRLYYYCQIFGRSK